MSTERQKLEQEADYEMLGYNAIQKGSTIARGGDIRQGQAIVKNFRRKMQSNITNEAQANQFRQYTAQCHEVYSGLNMASAQIEQREMMQV